MKSAVEKFEDLLAERGRVHYNKCTYKREFNLYLVDETPTSYVLTNGRGESVSDDRDINVQFMMMKNIFGFETIEDGEYVLRPSKFDNSVRLNCLTLCSHGDWIFRVVAEEEGFYLGLTNKSSPPNWDKVEHTDFFVKWIAKSVVTDVSHYWGGAPNRQR